MKVYIDTDDWWVGYYRGPHHHYVCLLPTVVIRWPRRHTANHRPHSDVERLPQGFGRGTDVFPIVDMPSDAAQSLLSADPPADEERLRAETERLRELCDLAMRARCIYCGRRWVADQIHRGHHDVCGDCHRGNQRARRDAERLREALRDVLDDLADQGVDTVDHPVRALLDEEDERE